MFTLEKLCGFLTDLGLPFSLYHHNPVFSVADPVDIDIPGTDTRNLFLRDKKGRMILVTLEAGRKLDLNKLADLLEMGRLSFGSPDRLSRHLGVAPGSVTPFAILNDKEGQVELVLDADMMKTEIVNFHPLVNTMTVGLSPGALLKVLDHANRPYRIVDLSHAAPD